MTEEFTINFPKATEKRLFARYDNMLQKAIEKAMGDNELYKPMVRMAGLCRWLDVSTTTIIKWQREGMPHTVIDGVTLYDKHKVTNWLEQFERNGRRVMKHTEKTVLSSAIDLNLTLDMLDVWEDKDGNLLFGDRGIQPDKGIKLIAIIDDGEVWF